MRDKVDREIRKPRLLRQHRALHLCHAELNARRAEVVTAEVRGCCGDDDTELRARHRNTHTLTLDRGWAGRDTTAVQGGTPVTQHVYRAPVIEALVFLRGWRILLL